MDTKIFERRRGFLKPFTDFNTSGEVTRVRSSNYESKWVVNKLCQTRIPDPNNDSFSSTCPVLVYLWVSFVLPTKTSDLLKHLFHWKFNLELPLSLRVVTDLISVQQTTNVSIKWVEKFLFSVLPLVKSSPIFSYCVLFMKHVKGIVKNLSVIYNFCV